MIFLDGLQVCKNIQSDRKKYVMQDLALTTHLDYVAIWKEGGIGQELTS